MNVKMLTDSPKHIKWTGIIHKMDEPKIYNLRTNKSNKSKYAYGKVLASNYFAINKSLQNTAYKVHYHRKNNPLHKLLLRTNRRLRKMVNLFRESHPLKP